MTIQQFFTGAQAINTSDHIDVEAKISSWGHRSVQFQIWSELLNEFFKGNTPEECIDAYLAANNGVKVDMDISMKLNDGTTVVVSKSSDEVLDIFGDKDNVI